MPLKNNIKTFIFFFLNIVSSFFSKKYVSILLYHSIDNNDVFLTLDPDIFAMQMKYLKDKNYNVISLSDLVHTLSIKKDIIKKTVVLTFDDGFLSHYKNVFPILQKYNYHATFFVSTGCLGSQMDNCENKPQPTLDWPELLKMNKSSLIDIEPHGVTHNELDNLNNKQVKKEANQSKKEIEERLNKKCDFFAYPRGKYNEKIIQILKEQGFKAAVIIEEGLINLGDDLFRLRRNTVDSSCSNNIQFFARLGRGIEIFNKLAGR